MNDHHNPTSKTNPSGPQPATATSSKSSTITSQQKHKPNVKEVFQVRAPGWSNMQATSVFKAVNFELFVKPNKFVMACGILAFTSCVSYIAYMNLTDEEKGTTYVTLDEDGGTTRRPRSSRWY